MIFLQIINFLPMIRIFFADHKMIFNPHLSKQAQEVIHSGRN